MGTLSQLQTRAAGHTSSTKLAQRSLALAPASLSNQLLYKSNGFAPDRGPQPARFTFNLGRLPIHPPTMARMRKNLSRNPVDARQESWSEGSAILRRTCACGGSCAGCQAWERDERRKLLRTQRAGAGDMARNGAPSIVHEALLSPGRPLDPKARAILEPRFGRDFSSVRIHTGGHAAESARAVDALAYTVGCDVVFGAGQYAPHTHSGLRLLAHELSHTIQNPDSGRLRPYLEIGRVDDPAERVADRAADAALRGEKVSIAADNGPALRRQARDCTATENGQDNQRKVVCGDAEFRVTMSSSPKPGKTDGDYQTEKTSPGGPETRTDVNAGLNGTNLSLTIDICRGGNEVRIKPIVDLPKAVEKALGNVISGSSGLKGVTLTPQIEFTIVHSDSTTVTLSPRVTVDEHGAQRYGGSVKVQTPSVTAQADVTYDRPTHAGFLTFTLTPGHTQKSPDCHTTDHTYLTLHCERITHVPAVPEVPEEKRTDTEIRYLFFKHAEHRVRSDFRLPTDIQSLHDSGYRVTAIDGFTSPEGPRAAGPGFEGNITLGQERADAALAWLRSKGVCEGCDFSGIVPIGHSELPPEQGKVEPEPKGPGMEREAVKEFLGKGPGQIPDPLAPQNPKALAAFERQPEHKQREQAFELQRRAAITFERTQRVKEAQPGKPAREEANPTACTPEIIQAARQSFGITF
jgi:hypothetical protein